MSKSKLFVSACLSALNTILAKILLRFLLVVFPDFSAIAFKEVSLFGVRYMYSLAIMRETSLWLTISENIQNFVPQTAFQKIVLKPLLRMNVTRKLLRMLQTRVLSRRSLSITPNRSFDDSFFSVDTPFTKLAQTQVKAFDNAFINNSKTSDYGLEKCKNESR